MNIRYNKSVMSWVSIIIGIVLLVFSLKILWKLCILIGGIVFFFYGISLKGFKGSSLLQRFLFRFF